MENEITMEQRHRDCDLLTGENYDGKKYDYCIECYRYETCKEIDFRQGSKFVK